MAVSFMLVHLTHSLEIVSKPYFASKNIVVGNTLKGVEIARPPQETFELIGTGLESLQDFFSWVKKSFEKVVSLEARDVQTFSSHPFTILNGVCILHLPFGLYSVQFTIDKGVKLNDNIIAKFNPFTNSYAIGTNESVKREMRYSSKAPSGESYTRVIACLNSFGAMTTTEIANRLGVPENRISGRLSEMRKCGLVRKCGTREINGRNQTLWVISGKRSGGSS